MILRGWLRRGRGSRKRPATYARPVTNLPRFRPSLTISSSTHSRHVEKAMKGYLSWHDQPFRKTHDLAEIGRQCAAIDVSLELLLKRAESLTVYAWAFRYPGDAENPSAEESQVALAIAREIVEAILARLPPDVRA